MLKKKIGFFALCCLLSLTSCQEISSTSAPLISSPTGNNSSTTTPATINYQEEILAQLNAMKKTPNYTLYIEDYDGDFIQYFNEKAWSFTFDNHLNITAYIEDENGIFPLIVDDGVVENDYYELDDFYENIFNIYDNITYSVGDLTLDKSLYTFDGKRMTLKDVESTDGISLFSLCGYDPLSTSAGTRLSDVDIMYFEIDDDLKLTANITFKDGTGRGSTIVHFNDIGTTSQPEKVQEFIDNDGHGIPRVPIDDDLFSYLASLKNLRNFTIDVKSDYQEEYNNYEMTSKYMKNAYYSHTDRAGEADIGYYQDEDGVRKMIIDSLNGDMIIGDLLTDSTGEVYHDLYTEALFSFADTYWDYSFKATFTENNNYRIDDYDYITDTANMTAAYTFRFSIDYLILSFDEEKKEYNFDFVFINDDHIYMRVYDIGTTQIGDIPIE